MLKIFRRFQKTSISLTVSLLAVSAAGSMAHADLGHVSCHVQMTYDYPERGSAPLPRFLRNVQLDLNVHEPVTGTLNVRSTQIRRSGQNFPIGISVTGSYTGAFRFTSGIPGQLQFSLTNPDNSLLLPAERFRSFEAIVPFFQSGNVPGVRPVPVNWSTAVIPRSCVQSEATLRSRVISEIHHIQNFLQTHLHNENPDLGWLALMARVQAANREAARGLTHDQRVELRRTARRLKEFFFGVVQLDLNIPTHEDPALNLENLTHGLRDRRDKLAHLLTALASLNGFSRHEDTISIGATLPLVLREYEAVLACLGVTDRSLTNPPYDLQRAPLDLSRWSNRNDAQWTNIVRRIEAAEHSAELAAQERATIIPVVFGEHATQLANGITEDLQRLEGFNPAEIQARDHICAVVRIRVNRCHVTNVIPIAVPVVTSPLDNPNYGVDASVPQDDVVHVNADVNSTTNATLPTGDASVIPEDASVNEDAGESPDDAGVGIPN